jgi:hypothetical protein
MDPDEVDLFGLERETKIVAAGVRNIFTPHSPINQTEFFFGRQREVQSLIEQLSTPGQHSLLYGERGVGKSSLANVTSNVLLSKLVRGKLYQERCDSSTTFESLICRALKDVNIDINIRQVDSKSKDSKKLDIKASIFGGGVSKEKETSESRSGPSEYVSPSFAAESLIELSGLLVIDEADRLTKTKDKRKLAEFIKLLSDIDAKFKVLIVGISETGEELIESHESISRCLRETRLGRMFDPELKLIISGGSERLGLSFRDEVVNKIVELSAGYPHFTHLLALKCSEDAIAEDYKCIEMEHLKRAMKRAVEASEGSLKRTYDRAVRSHATDKYSIILNAAASLDKTEFNAAELRDAIYRRTGEKVSQQALNNYFKKLVSSDGSRIMQRISKGVYRFNDPRMPSYIKIAQEAE